MLKPITFYFAYCIIWYPFSKWPNFLPHLINFSKIGNGSGKENASNNLTIYTEVLIQMVILFWYFLNRMILFFVTLWMSDQNDLVVSSPK